VGLALDLVDYYDTVGWVIRPVKSSLKWHILCRVGHYALLYHTIPYCDEQYYFITTYLKTTHHNCNKLIHCISKVYVPTYILLCVCQIWTGFNKNWYVSRNKHLTKLCIKCPLHLKYVLALPSIQQHIQRFDNTNRLCRLLTRERSVNTGDSMSLGW